jgi:hypothetical protein
MRIVGVAALCAVLGGCASVSRGTTENISIVSTPAGAEATVSGLEVPTACMTPCSVVVKRNADVSVAFRKDGYQPQMIQLTKEIPPTGAAGFAGNVLIGGLVGMGVDAYTGAATDHKPNPVTVTLEPLAPPAPARPGPPRKPRTPAAPQAGS